MTEPIGPHFQARTIAAGESTAPSSRTAPSPDTAPPPLANALLSLASADLPWWQEWTGLGSASKARVGRCLRCHRSAVEAETAGRFKRADFYWRALHRQFRSMLRSGAWSTVEGELTAQGVDLSDLSGRPLANVIAEELIIDTHLAAIDACAANEYLVPRAWQHVAYVLELVQQSGMSGLPADFAERALGLRLLTQLEKAVEAKRWKDAHRAGGMLIEAFPARRAWRDALARVHFMQAIEGVKSASDDATHLANAKVLARAIAGIEALRRKTPRELGLLVPLAELRRFRAVQLANGGRLSDAYLENEKAASHHPDDDQIKALRETLAKALKDLQQQVTVAVGSLGPNQQLNAKGQQLVAQARSGVTPGQTYAASAEAQRLAADFRAAIAEWKPPSADAPPEAIKPSVVMQLPHAAPRWRDVEPIGAWLFSLDMGWSKLAALAAIIVLATVGWRASAEREDRRVRSEAYEQARGAMAAHDYGRVMTAAGRFFDVTLTVPDEREPEVRRMYSESLVRWFDAQQEAPPRDHPHLARYRQLFPDTSRVQP